MGRVGNFDTHSGRNAKQSTENKNAATENRGGAFKTIIVM